MDDLILADFVLTASQLKHIAKYLCGTESDVEDYLKDFGISDNPQARDIETIEVELAKRRLAERCSECGIWMKVSELKGRNRICSGCINSMNSYYR